MATEHSRRFTPIAAVPLVVAIIVCLGVGALGSLVTMPNIPTWYAELAKPRWTPPDWLFGPVWTTLYGMMGTAAWLVWRRAGWGSPLAWFAVQLALNATWSWCFFGLHSPLAGLVNIGLLWLAIGGTIATFWRVSKTAAVLLLPYWLWVSFASFLNAAIWQLNR